MSLWEEMNVPVLYVQRMDHRTFRFKGT